MLELPGVYFSMLQAPEKYRRTDLAGFLILFFVNTKVQIHVWALVLDEVIFVEVNCSQFFWPGYLCDLKSQSISF